MSTFCIGTCRGATLLLAARQQNANLIVYNSGELSRFLSPLLLLFVLLLVNGRFVSFRFRLTRPAELTDVSRTKATRCKLEHYGFQQLARPVPLLRSNKRLPTTTTTKRLRAMNVTPNTYASSPSRSERALLLSLSLSLGINPHVIQCKLDPNRRR